MPLCERHGPHSRGDGGHRHTQANWDTFMKELRESGASLEPAAGVGDGAFFWDAHRLYAHTGNYQIAVSTSPSSGDDPAKIRASSIALAKALIAKLKG